MAYFVTGATGFIGRHLLAHLAARGETLYCLVRPSSEDRLREIATDLEDLPSRIVPLVGDLLSPRLGLVQEEVDRIAGDVEHFFHLAALYDLGASSDTLVETNVGGTRNALELALEVEAGCFHHLSTLVVAGPKAESFAECDFDPDALLPDPYAATKHDAEALVRSSYGRPSRIYRPSVVVGDSVTGETDKADGIYYVFPLIRRLRESVPDWIPRFGVDAGRLDLVPVDYVARAIDFLAHAKDLDGRTFHLCDPTPRKASEVVDEFCRVAGAPRFSAYLPIPRVPSSVSRLLDATEQLGPVRRAYRNVFAELGVPPRLLRYLRRTTQYTCGDTIAALEGSGISPPALEAYAAPLWDYWEKTFAPLLVRSAKLAAAVSGKRVLVMGADGALESEVALRVGAAGANVILVGFDRARLRRIRRRVEGAGGRGVVHVVDSATPDEMEALANELRRRYDAIDVAICGGTSATEPNDDGDALEDLDDTRPGAAMRARCLAPLEMILALGEWMRERGSGHLLVLSPTSLDGASHSERAAVAALDAYVSEAASEIAADGVATTVLQVPRIEGSSHAKTRDATGRFGAVPLERAVEMACTAIVTKPRRSTTLLDATTSLARSATPEAFEAVSTLLRRAARWDATGRERTGGVGKS